MLTGTPSVFIRTSGCNLRCSFCDTPFASWNPEGEMLPVEEILRQVNDLSQGSSHLFESLSDRSIKHVVITGGEPMIAKTLPDLCQRLRLAGYHITIETAGTVWQELDCDLMSISPKFSNSTPPLERAGSWLGRHEKTRFKPQIVAQLIHHHDFQLKFVVDQPTDLNEIEAYLKLIFLEFENSKPERRSNPTIFENKTLKPYPEDLAETFIREPNIDWKRVMLMPQGIDEETLKAKEAWLSKICDEKGFTFCPRLHIQWYGNQRAT